MKLAGIDVYDPERVQDNEEERLDRKYKDLKSCLRKRKIQFRKSTPKTRSIDFNENILNELI